MKEDFIVEDEMAFTDEDEETLRSLRTGFNDDDHVDPVTGRKEKSKSKLNVKRKLSKHEMDEIFLDWQ